MPAKSSQLHPYHYNNIQMAKDKLQKTTTTTTRSWRRRRWSRRRKGEIFVVVVVVWTMMIIIWMKELGEQNQVKKVKLSSGKRKSSISRGCWVAPATDQSNQASESKRKREDRGEKIIEQNERKGCKGESERASKRDHIGRPLEAPRVATTSTTFFPIGVCNRPLCCCRVCSWMSYSCVVA